MKALITTINIDSSAIQQWIPKLNAIHRSAFPIAIRRTLNQAAMDVKQVTMPAETDKDFIKRQPTFFSAVSHVEFAKGFDVNGMAAIVGFTPAPGRKEIGMATKDLEEQEEGGDIDKRAFIATRQGRTGRGNVKQALRMGAIRTNIVDAKEEQGKNNAERFIKAAVRAGKGGFVISPWTNRKGNKYLMQIKKVKEIKKGGHIIDYKEVYSVKAHRKAHVKATHFMDIAARISAAKMEEMFAANVEIEINKIRNA